MANVHATASDVHHIPMLISEMFTEAGVQSRTFEDPERPGAPPRSVTKVVTRPTCGHKATVESSDGQSLLGPGTGMKGLLWLHLRASASQS